MKTTKKAILQIFKDNNICNNNINHNLIAAKKAANYMIYGNNANAIDIIKLVFFNEPISNLYTHNYGFHTRQGRAIIEEFKNLYHSYDN
mgnify:CR=1 FL=1